MNISGIVVRTAPENVDEVIENLRATGLCDIHFNDPAGKIIVTVEGRDISEEMRKMKEIMAVPGVLCANLAYTYSEEETQNALELIKDSARAVPEALR